MSERDLNSACLHVGYILKQYPRLSETFILSEILGLEQTGVDVSVFSLRPATEEQFHPATASVRATVHYLADLEKAAFSNAFNALSDLHSDRLADIFDFVEHLPMERRANLILQATEIAGAARRTGINHLHAHFLTVAAQTAHLVHLLTGLPYSVTAHAKDIYRHAVDWDLAAAIAADAAAVVTVCDANLEFLTNRLGTGPRLVRVYNGLGAQEAPVPAAARTPGLVLGVGRLVEKKGFDLLLDAVAALADDRPDLHCVLVGDGDQRAALQAQATRLGIDRLVTFTGSLPQNEVAGWLRRAQLMAAPCRVGTDGNQDALPTVLLEALGAGLPAVTTPVAGIPEIITNGVEGIIVDCDDSIALASGIEALLDDPQRLSAMSQTGPSKLARHFDRATTIRHLIQTFRTPELVP
jgi:glycosyltransferase involved in cell wall biosynthesis